MSLSSINIVLGAITEAYNASVNKAAETMDRVSKRMQKSADEASKGVGDALGSGQLRQKIESVSAIITEQKEIYREMSKELEDLRQKRDTMSKSDIQGQKAVRAEIERTKNGLKEISRDTAELTAKKQALTQQLSSTNQTLGGTRAALNGLATSFSAVSSVIGIMADDNKALRNTLMALNAALNFSAAIMQVKDLQEQFGGLTKFLTNPWVLASIAVAAAGAAIYAYSTQVSQAEQMQRDLNKEFLNATKAAKENEVSLNGYLAIVNDTQKSEKERRGALLQLKEAGIAVDDINIKTAKGQKLLNERVQDSIKLSIQKAIADRASAKIAEIEIQRIEKVNKTREEGAGILNQFRQLTLPGFNAALYETNAANDEAKQLTDLYTNALNNAQLSVAKLTAKTNGATLAQSSFNANLKNGSKEAEKEAAALKKLEESLLNPKNTGKSLLAPVDPIVTQSMNDVLQKMDEIPAAAEGVKVPPLFTDVIEEAPTTVQTTVEIGDAFKEMADRNSATFQQNASDLYADGIRTKEWSDKKIQALDQVNAAFANLQMQTAENFGQFVADLATGEEKAGKNFGRNMVGAIANFMSVVGKAMVATAIASQKFEELLLANPAAAAVAGLALITGAAIVRNELKKGPEYTAFADGGIVSGPTLGLMGEYPGASTNPEVIAPLDKLKALMRPPDSGGGFVASTFVSGRDLAIVLNRHNQDTKRG